MKKKFTDEDLQLLLAQGLSQAEIARKVGVSEQAVSWRVKRLRAKQTSQAQDLPASSVNSNISLKDQLNLKELKFLELYLSGEYTIENAMIGAGYGNYHPRARYRIASKIVQKYESQAEDARKIFREIGFGELSVAEGIKRLAQQGKSEVIRLNAHALAARCLQMTSPPPMVSAGVQIIIRGQDDDEPDHAPKESSPCRRPSIRFQQEVINKRKPLESLQIVD